MCKWRSPKIMGIELVRYIAIMGILMKKTWKTHTHQYRMYVIHLQLWPVEWFWTMKNVGGSQSQTIPHRMATRFKKNVVPFIVSQYLSPVLWWFWAALEWFQLASHSICLSGCIDSSSDRQFPRNTIIYMQSSVQPLPLQFPSRGIWTIHSYDIYVKEHGRQ